MSEEFLCIRQSKKLQGTVHVSGAKNAALPILASLILIDGVSTLYNIPNSADVQCMLMLLQNLGAQIVINTAEQSVRVDTSTINKWEVPLEIMQQMRASFLVIGPLLARFGKAHIALPGGCVIGARPVNYHLDGLRALGVIIQEECPYIIASFNKKLDIVSRRIVLEYPSVGATEILIMFAALLDGEVTIVNAALEPEVIDVIDVLRAMGVSIEYLPGAMIRIHGVSCVRSIQHTIVADRLEAGALLLAAAMTGGSIHLPNARGDHMDIFLKKMRMMGHKITIGTNPVTDLPLQGVMINATQFPQAVSIKTGPYPAFPTDLQALMTAALCFAEGVATVEETVFENRLMHVVELQKMGAQISVSDNKAFIKGVKQLQGCTVVASDIRASCGLVLAGLVAEGETRMSGLRHWRRGYDQLEVKLARLGACIDLTTVEVKIN